MEHSPNLPEHGDKLSQILLDRRLVTDLAGDAIIPETPVGRTGNATVDRAIR
jgi:hypothetical protein